MFLLWPILQFYNNKDMRAIITANFLTSVTCEGIRFMVQNVHGIRKALNL